jgi:hypothetical protein
MGQFQGLKGRAACCRITRADELGVQHFSENRLVENRRGFSWETIFVVT